MYACICRAVTVAEVAETIAGGAGTEEAVGEACGAGTGCGYCLERISAMLSAADPGGGGRHDMAALSAAS